MKRIISVLLTVALLLSLCVTAFAAPTRSTGATIVFKSIDVYGDGTGFQLLLDKDASTYGVIYDDQAFFSGNNYIKGNISSSYYKQFEYKLPSAADGTLTTSNILKAGTLTMTVPAGTYDSAVTNPTPGDYCYIVQALDNIVFRNGYTYTFSVASAADDNGVYAYLEFDTDDPGASRVVLSDYGDLLTGWYFEDKTKLGKLTFEDADGDGHGWDAYYDLTSTLTIKEGHGCLMSASYNDECFI